LNKLKIIELFSGIGAYAKAFERSNMDFEIVSAIELDDKTMDSYNLIHNSNFNPSDITTLNEKTLPDCDVICYSPPCQAFSNAGKQLGFDDKRGVLFFDALRIIKEKMPKYCIMENVKGLTQKKFQNEFKSMLDSLKETGYKNYWKVLNAKDHGIPQNRERVFIISVRNDVDQEFKFPETIPYKFTLKDILEPDAELPILHNIYGGFKEDKPRVFEEYSPTIRTAAGGGHIPSVCIKGCSLRTRNYIGQPQKLEIRKDDVSNAITTVQKDSMLAIIDDTYKNREERVYENYSPAIRSQRKGFKVVDGREIRNLSTLECFRLMDFDDQDYYILKQNGFKDTPLYKLAGNSIVVNVLEEIFKILFQAYVINNK
jgi:DNA (cytosine-5)-methyltransferase 1